MRDGIPVVKVVYFLEGCCFKYPFELFCQYAECVISDLADMNWSPYTFVDNCSTNDLRLYLCPICGEH
jgi:hypothetical protein